MLESYSATSHVTLPRPQWSCDSSSVSSSGEEQRTVAAASGAWKYGGSRHSGPADQQRRELQPTPLPSGPRFSSSSFSLVLYSLSSRPLLSVKSAPELCVKITMLWRLASLWGGTEHPQINEIPKLPCSLYYVRQSWSMAIVTVLGLQASVLTDLAVLFSRTPLLVHQGPVSRKASTLCWW